MWNDDKDTRSYWAIEHANTQQFIGRAYDHWTRGSIVTAALFDSRAEAESARQALLQESRDRLSNSEKSWPSDFWWDISGGLVTVTEVERILQRRKNPDANYAVDPVVQRGQECPTRDPASSSNSTRVPPQETPE